MGTNFTTPTGRLVWGDPFKAEPVVDDKTKQQKRDAAGQPIFEFALGVAFAKNDPLWPAFRKQLKDADRQAWPQFHDANGEILPGVKFADKITDGDGFNTKGKARARGDNGYAGHWVVKFASRFPPGVNYYDGRQWVQTNDPKALKCGDYIQVNGSTATNKSDQSPGMHRNVSLVAIFAQGQEIQKGADPNEAFGAPPPGGAQPPPPPAPGAPPPNAYVPAPVAPPPPAAPPPAMSSPIMLASANGATYDQMIAAGWTDATLIQAGHMQAPVQVAPPVQPSTSYMGTPAAAPPPAPAAPPPPPAAPPPPPAAPMRTMLPAAGGATYEAMIAAGWTDATLVANGMMAA